MHYHFLEYATRHVFDHVSLSGQASSPLLSKITAFIRSGRWIYSLENAALLSLEDDWYLLLMDKLARLKCWLEKANLGDEKLLQVAITQVRQ